MEIYKLYSSLVQAVNPKTGKLQVYEGMDIIARSFEEAQESVEIMGLGYYIINEELFEANFIMNLN